MGAVGLPPRERHTQAQRVPRQYFAGPGGVNVRSSRRPAAARPRSTPSGHGLPVSGSGGIVTNVERVARG